MKEYLKNILKHLRIYHPLQRIYRRRLTSRQHHRILKEYEPFRNGVLFCNFCGESYSQFAPRWPSDEDREALVRNSVIAGYGENCYCPSCMSTARERLIKAVISDDFALEGKQILHFSPEKKILDFILEKNDVTTADLEPGFYSAVHKQTIKQDLTSLQFQDSSFDIVIANHVMEHIPDDLQAMKEVYRVLKKNGTAIMQVPFSTSIKTTIEQPGLKDPRQQSALFGQKDHVRIYELEDYLSRLREVGFDVNYQSYDELKAYHQFAIQTGEGFIRISK